MRYPRSIQILDVAGPQEHHDQLLHVRIADRIRRAILGGSLLPGARLPSARVLARDLNMSRPTVERAFDRLQAEGFVVRRRGSGSFVAASVPERERLPQPIRRAVGPAKPETPISVRGRVFTAYPGHPEPANGTAFTPSLPAVELFPRRVWGRLLSRAIQRPGALHWTYGATAGLSRLREAIAAHVAGSRGAACSPEQVIVLSSAQQGVDLAVRVLLDPGDAAWVEDPSYPPAVHLLRAAGAQVSAIPVDTDGLDVDTAIAIQPAARLAYVTPSHQYPSGGTMSLPRRLALLGWAAREGAWILEDDYDGDLRYAGRPLASLQALDRSGRVIYIGTFNKVMFSSLRIAFLIAPAALVEPLVNAKHLMDGHPPGHTQAALADFLGEGHLANHLRELLDVYDRRRRQLIAELDTLSDVLEIGPSDAGLHLAAYLRRPLDDRRISAECAKAGVDLHPLSRFYVGPARAGFVMGFACARPAQQRSAMEIVARTIRAQKSSSRRARVAS
jgi:GntR family transcriptional regulator/MocR family aminotransferase